MEILVKKIPNKRISQRKVLEAETSSVVSREAKKASVALEV